MILVVLYLVVISGLLLFHWRITLFFICHVAQLDLGLLRRWRPDTNFVFILFRNIHFVLPLLRLWQSLLLACFQFLRHHGLYVSLWIILFKRAFGRLRENKFFLDLVIVHLIQNQRSLEWLINSINRLPIFHGEFRLNRVFRWCQAFITLHDVSFTINWFWDLLGWHKFRRHIRVLWLLLFRIWMYFSAHFLHNFIIALFFKLTAQLCDETLKFSVVFLHFGNTVVLYVFFLPILVISLSFNSSQHYRLDLCLFEERT